MPRNLCFCGKSKRRFGSFDHLAEEQFLVTHKLWVDGKERETRIFTEVF